MKILNFILFLQISFILIGCASNFKNNKVKTNFELTSNFGLYLSTMYSLKIGDNDNASKLISKSKSLHLDTTLAELNFNTYLINGDFEKAKEFKLIAPVGLKKLPIYNLPDFIINFKSDRLINPLNFNLIKNQLPGFKIIFKSINYLNLVRTNNLKDIILNKSDSNIFNLLIFENTKIEQKIYLNMSKINFTLIENILYLGYLKRKYPNKFNIKINEFSSKYNYDIKNLKLYFENEQNIRKKPDHQFIIANLFSYLSFRLSSKKNIPNSYLKILNEIAYYLEPTLGSSNFFLAEIYSRESNYKIALKKLDRINQNSFMFLKSKIKKYKIFKVIDKNNSNIFLKTIQNQYPDNNELLFLIANNYKDQNKCRRAIKIYDRLIKNHINQNNYYFFKAICLDRLNNWEDSKKILMKLISENPNNAYVLNYLSYSMVIRNEDLYEAKKLINRALEIEKNNGFFLDTLGWIQFKLNDVDEAVSTIQKAIVLEPNNSEIIDHLGDIYYKIGRKKEAIFEWNRALIGNGDNKLKKDIKSKLKKYTK